MKFAQKLSVAMIFLLAVSFSIGGYFMVRQNFHEGLEVSLDQNEARHMLECYAVQSDILTALASGEIIDDSMLSKSFSQLSENQHASGTTLYGSDDAIIATNIKSQPSPKITDTSSYVIASEGSTQYMVLSTQLTSPTRSVWLQSTYDITPLYQMRTAQLLRFWQIELLTLLCGAFVIWRLSKRLAQPVTALSKASESIAKGDYTVRTAIKTGDEFENVSQSFDFMAQSVEEKVEELNTSLQQRNDFMGAFSHELKTPMTAIIGYADTMRSMQFDPQRQREASQYIFTEAKRIEDLSQKLLSLMGISKEAITLKPVQLQSVFSCVANSASAILNDVPLKMQTAQGVTVLADFDLLCDLIYNLIHNSVKANPKNGILCTWQRTDNGVIITVADTGCGIPPDKLSRIIEPFYMVDKSRARAGGGSGMGLALCDKIARAHGTQLTIKSTVDKGTSVSFTLKAQEGQNEKKS